MKINLSNGLLMLGVLFSAATNAKTVEIELEIAENHVEIAGKTRKALTINGGIPGPVLRFQEGDVARITVHNRLESQETSVHWHGLLLPNAEDGVPYLTTPPIPAGGNHVFEFPLIHSGTYWYHSHTGLQEQLGVYGSIVVTPKGGDRVAVDQDHVLVLSDWTDESPTSVMRTLMRGSEYYAVKKGNAQSLLGAIRAGGVRDWLDREKSRMPPMDISDVAYDAFLINGKPTSTLNAKPGQKLRLRIVNAGASSYFYVHSAAGALTILAADGVDVEPLEVDRLLIGIAETYDVLFTVPEDGAWELRATAQDNSGYASVFIGDGNQRDASSLPSPNLYSMEHMLEGALVDGLEAARDAAASERPPSPVDLLKSPTPTALAATHPRRDLELRLTGDMQRYIWSFNGKTLSENATIPVKLGEVLRLTLVNDTMMHHPIHLHGHFFRVVNGHGEHSPLKHTVDVPPMGKRTLEFLADEEGDWFFHCHLLYHMDAGMARVFSTHAADDPEYRPDLDPKLINPPFLMLDGMILKDMTMGMAMVMKGREDFGFSWDYMSDDHQEYEYDLFWNHYFNPQITAGIGYRFTNEHGTDDRGFVRLQYLLPYFVESEISADTEGDLRFKLEKEIALTARLSAFGEIEYDTNAGVEWMSGLDYLLNKEFSLTGLYHRDHGWTAGLTFRF